MMLDGRRGRSNNSQFFSDGFLDGVVPRSRERGGVPTILVSSSMPTSCNISLSSSASSSSSGSPSGLKYFEHRVSKMDTLAGVAIKYGVEVADIKRLNGLVTDLHMYAHKSLQIPLPGRHPPSPFVSNDTVDSRDQSPAKPIHDSVSDLVRLLNLKSPRSEVSPDMNSLRGYNSLMPTRGDPTMKGSEMAVYGTNRRFSDDELWESDSSFSEPLQGRHRKCRSMANGFPLKNDAYKLNHDATDTEVDRSIRRRQKTDAPEMIMKEDNSNGFLVRLANGLALRTKSGMRNDVDMGLANGIPNGDSSASDALFSVRKSSSTPSLQDSESNSIWPAAKWMFKPDVIARPILEGFQIPIAPRRSKAALD